MTIAGSPGKRALSYLIGMVGPTLESYFLLPLALLRMHHHAAHSQRFQLNPHDVITEVQRRLEPLVAQGQVPFWESLSRVLLTNALELLMGAPGPGLNREPARPEWVTLRSERGSIHFGTTALDAGATEALCHRIGAFRASRCGWVVYGTRSSAAPETKPIADEVEALMAQMRLAAARL